MGEKLLVSPSPHVRAKGKTSLIMLMVIVALLPSCVYGVLNFGMHALLILVLSTGSAVAAELVYELVMRKKITVTDGSAAVTGLLVGMNMPPMIAWWIPVIGSVFAIVVVKQLFGGLGRNFMNPALAARCFLVLAFSAQMTAFTTGTGVLSQVTEPTVMAEAGAEADAGANENAGTDADSTATAWTEAQTEAAEKTDADSAATAETEEKGKAAAAAKTDADSRRLMRTQQRQLRRRKKARQPQLRRPMRTQRRQPRRRKKARQPQLRRPMRTQRQQPRRRKQQMRLPGQRLRRRQRLRKRRLRIPASWMLCRQRHR